MRPILIVAVTVIAGGLAYWGADGVLHAVATCVPIQHTLPSQRMQCTSPGYAPEALSFLGALAGFWLAYTGRIARLFRRP